MAWPSALGDGIERSSISVTDRATIDYETRSACPIRKTGSWRYALDESTEILCLAYRLPSWEPGITGLWHPEFPSIGLPAHEDIDTLLELFEWVESGGLVEAHNAWFERGVWTNIFHPRYGAPLIQHEQWRCSAAKAAALSLPRSLEGAIEALRLPIAKDLDGEKVMKKITKPRKPRKKERELWVKEHGDTPHPIVYHESKELFERLFAYCRQDVLAEEALSEAIPDLSPEETSVYLLDQAVNERGFQLDMGAVTTALTLIEQETVVLSRELVEITEGAVTKATQRKRIIDWAYGRHGVTLPDTTAETLDYFLASRDLCWPVRRVLEILQMLGRSSTAKYEAMTRWACPDARVRGGMLYHGASTGRWSGAGVQPHNFPKGKLKDWDMEDAWATLNLGDRELISSIYGSVMEPLSQGLRGAIVASEGKQLFVADYAAIEARVLLWLARELEALDIFRRGDDIYCEMASRIYNRVITKKDKNERQLGKFAVLGLGYGMGAAKFVDTAATWGITVSEEFAKQIVTTYRETFSLVPVLWNDQEQGAIEAVDSKDPVDCRFTTWQVDAPFLYCTLPSGRRLAYPFPEIHKRTMPWGEKRWGLTYMGVDGYSHKWKRQVTYGGMLVENITQAVSRDIMAEAMLRAEESGVYEPVLSVHDELVAEGDPDMGDIHDFERLVAECPIWAEGCPIAAEGFVADRYRK